MKKILGLTIVFLLSISLVTSGVWAYFSDVEVSSSNILTAGTLDLVPTTSGTGPAGKYTVTAGGNGVNSKVVIQKLLPGETGSIEWVLVNNGSISGTLFIASTVTFDENGSNEVEAAVTGNNGGGNGDLDSYMGVTLQRGIGTNQADAETHFTYILGSAGSYAPFSSLQTALNNAGAVMAVSGGNDTIVYQFTWEIGSIFGSVNQNIIQSDSAQIDITFTLNQ